VGKPTLVVVSGPSGSGKTTLAHRLGLLIGCPVVSRDEIKEGMVQANPGFVAGPGDELTLRTLGVFFEAVELMIRNDVTVVAEAAFQDPLWRSGLEPLLGLANVRVIHCVVDADTARARQVRRRRDNPVRAAHADRNHLSSPAGAYVPLALNVPTMCVDTTDGYRPGLPEIAQFAGSGSSTNRVTGE
jgi:predicted kinase